ncbi:MAG: hypothetical protein HQL26_10185 [Candidatus Omnitrophica bacterium]|nr:hypothetical protein [Candidatus Omnitrophota bacterium]
MKKKLFLYTLIFLTVLSAGFYFRLYPLTHFGTGDASEKASLLVMNQIHNSIREKVLLASAELPDAEKEILVKKTFDEYLPRHRNEINSKIEDFTRQINAQNPTVQHFPYLLESDPFYYYDLTDKLLKTGSMGEKKGSKYLNPKMLAPKGQWEPFNLHPYIGAFTYKFLKCFNSQITLMEAVSFTPLFLTAFALLIFLFASYFIFEFKPVVSFISAVFLILTPIFVKRSALGWYDDDAYNVIFPLLLFSILFYAIKNIRNKPKVLLAGLLLCLIFPIYTLFWQGWIFLLGVLTLCIIAIGLSSLFLEKDRTTVSHSGILGAMLVGGAFCGISVLFGPNQFFALIAEAWDALKKFSSTQINVWPDIFMTVGELEKASSSFIIDYTIGWIGFVIIVSGIIILAIKRFQSFQKSQLKNYEDVYKIGSLVLFAGCGLYLALGAQRFTFLCITPLILLLAYGLQAINDILHDYFNNHSPIKKLSLYINIGLILLILFPIIHMKRAIPGLLDPIYNDTWDLAMKEIKEKTPTDSIINTWWPPGHFIKAMADRRVTFDGASIGVPQAYWLAAFFLSQSENEALGTLRMINSSGNDAVVFLNNFGIKTSTAVQIIKQIVKMPKPAAQQFLSQYIKDPQVVDILLQLTHGRPAPSYCLIYKEFADNNIQLSMFGKWDFQKMETINQHPQLLGKIPDRKSPAYIDFLWQLVGGAYKFSGTLSELNAKDNLILFQDGIQIDIKNLSATISSPKYGRGKPFSIFYINDSGMMVENIQSQSNLSYSIALLKAGPNWECILMDRALARSMLVRLYYFKDKGLKYFEPFSDISDLTGRNRIITYKVDWDKFYADKEKN